MAGTVIRATEQNRAVQQVAFNFDDLAAQANRYVEKVRADAAQIIAEARKEAEQIKQRAVAEGRAAGQQAVQQMVQQQVGQRVATLLPALSDAVAQIRHARQAYLTHWEKSAVHVAAAIAGRIVRRELQRDPQITLTLVREALELAAGGADLRVHLNPADHQALGQHVAALLRELSGLGQAQLLADPAIAVGGCRVETRFGVVDQQWETQLARIEEELT